MKKIFSISIYVILCTLLMMSCDLFQSNKPTNKVMSAEEAKIELKSVNQDLTSKFDQMLATPAMGSLNYLASMAMSDDDMKSAKTARRVHDFATFSYSKALNYFRGERSVLKSGLFDDDNDGMYGYLEYNFNTGEFEMVKESNSVLQLKYPANETAEYNQTNNAVLTISNLKFTTINSTEEYYDYYTESMAVEETTEQIPVSASVEITIDNKKELVATYAATFNSQGLPLSVNATKEAGGYKLVYSFLGNGTKYNSKLSYKLGSDELMGHDLNIVYAANMEDILKVEGDYTAIPIKLSGYLNVDAINSYMEEIDENDGNPDITFLNSQLDVVVTHISKKATIGNVEFRMSPIDEWGDINPELAIIYNDGTYEWLFDVMGIEQ